MHQLYSDVIRNRRFKAGAPLVCYSHPDALFLRNIAEHFERLQVFTLEDHRYDESGQSVFVLTVQTDEKTFADVAEQKAAWLTFHRIWQGALVEPSTAGQWRYHFAHYLRNRFCENGDIELYMVEAAKDGTPFDLRDALTFSYWLEYLSEYQERRDAWRDFEAEHGPVVVILG